MKSRILLVFLLVIGAGIIFVLQTKESLFEISGDHRTGESVTAPDFTLPDLDGRAIRLSEFKGKVVLLNIWATWCLPCVEEMPSMEKLHQALRGDGFAILAVSIDESGAKTVAPFMKKHNLSFTALTDTKGIVKNLYRTTGVPESFIIDKKGIIVEKIIGARDWSSPVVIDYFRNLISAK